TYLNLFAAYKVKKDSMHANDYNTLYFIYRDSIERLMSGRMLSPDSLTRELQEKGYVADLLSLNKEEKASALPTHQLEYNQKLTEAELERLNTDRELAKMKQYQMEDEIADNEREDRIHVLQSEKAMQDLIISQRALQESKQKQLINLLVTGVIVVLVFLGFMYYRYLSKKRSHRELDKAYAELNKTHQQLKAMQDQLVHAEKMASLGQLTAGIAHEIQNPLNFVNNFSELSVELLNEALTVSNEKDRTDIIRKVGMNLEKISAHGKRADSIVKGMLLHSRNGTTEKTPTDINKLAEEYF